MLVIQFVITIKHRLVLLFSRKKQLKFDLKSYMQNKFFIKTNKYSKKYNASIKISLWYFKLFFVYILMRLTFDKTHEAVNTFIICNMRAVF